MNPPRKKRFAYAIDELASEIVENSEDIETSKPVLTSESLIDFAFQPSLTAPNQPKKKTELSAPSTSQESENLGNQMVGERMSAERPTQRKGTAKGKKMTSETVVTSQLSAVPERAVSLSVGNLEDLLLPPQKRGRKDSEGTGRMAIPREQTTIRLRPELKRAAAAAAALEGITLGDLIERALIEHLSRK